MKSTVEKQQDSFFEALLESIKPRNEEYIEKRIKHISFAKIICWLCIESRKRTMFYPDELRRFMRFERSTIHVILKGITESGFLIKSHQADSKVHYSFVKDEQHLPKIRIYFERALRTLGKKPKREITFKLEEEIGSEEDYFNY